MIYSYFCRVCLSCVAFLLFTDFAIAQNSSLEQIQDQTNLSNNQQTPFMLLNREILSDSQDIMGCFHGEQGATQSFQNVIEKKLSSALTLEEGGGVLSVTNQDQIEETTETTSDLLLGIPLAMLSKPLAIGTSVIDISVSDNDNEFQNPGNMQRYFARYRDFASGVLEMQMKLTGSRNGQCLLKFVHCPRAVKDSCLDSKDRLNHYDGAGIPILGISQKHQAVIMDLNSFGDDMKSIMSRNWIIIPLDDTRTSPVELSDSNFIFDITSNAKQSVRVPTNHPNVFLSLPLQAQITSRWFIKFDLLESEKGFVSRPPTEGVNYYVTENAVFPEKTSTPSIARWRIFKDNQINPVHFYIKNVPYQYQEAFVQGFEYWNSIFVSQIAKVNPALSHKAQVNPPLSYTFIQDNYDGQQEIISGDIRFNVLEWDTQYKRAYRGRSILFFNQHTGESLSSNILIQGPQLVDLYQKWFQYSKVIRRGGGVQEDMSFSPRNYIVSDGVLDLISLVPGSSNVQFMKLAPVDETLDNFIFHSLERLVAHELGHALGLDHNFKGNTTAGNSYVSSSVMDYNTLLYDFHKPISSVYDKMAIAYGYLGLLPDEDQTNMTCTDSENVHLLGLSMIWRLMDQGSVPEYLLAMHENMNPECSPFDSGAFPLERFFKEIQHVIDLLLTKQNTDPHYFAWNRSVRNYVGHRILSILYYYFFADARYNDLQSVLIEGRKPKKPQEVKDMIVNDYIQPLLCHAKLNTLLEEYVHHRSQGTIDSLSDADRMLQNNAIYFWDLLYNIYIKAFNIEISCPA